MLRKFVGKLLGRDLLVDVSATTRRTEVETRIAAAMARAAATAAARSIDPKAPLTWEFGGFSQHGEDGILDFLCSRLRSPNRFFFEIGAADGLQNCTAWLAFARNFAGVWVEGDPALTAMAERALASRIWNVHCVSRFVEPACLPELLGMCPYRDPDVFSLDIDSTDYHIGSKVLELGFRPKIWVVEYNSAFGPDRPVTVPFSTGFNRWADPSGLYYGCSIAGWRRLFEGAGYQFITVDSSGINAFFIDPSAFPSRFAEGMEGLSFRDNEADLNGATRPYTNARGARVLPRRDWREQMALIAKLPLVEIDGNVPAHAPPAQSALVGAAL
jgi:hypothetical protein